MLQPKNTPEHFPRENEMYISHLRPSQRRPVFKQRFLVQSGEKLIPVTSSEIAYFYAEDRWTYLITRTNKKYLIEHKLKELEALMHPDKFFRVNRSYLVASHAIVSLLPYLKGQLRVRLKPAVPEEVIVSRAKTPPLKDWLNT